MKYVVGILIAAVIGAFALLWGPQLSHGAYIFFTGGAFVLLPLFALIVLVVLCIVLQDKMFLPVLVILAVVGLTLTSWVRYSYDLGTKYLADVEISEKAVPDFAERAAFDVAAAGAERLLGDTTGDAQNVKALVDQQESGEWNALVVSRGAFPGYESVQVQNTPLYGAPTSKDVETCEFNGAVSSHRLGGFWPAESMEHKVLSALPVSVSFQNGDVYAYCDGDTPKVVFPLQSLDGFWTPTWNVFGAAVYDGSLGSVSVVTDTSDIPGHVYPISLAKTQRDALLSDGSFEDRFFNKSGWEDTSADEGDPNGQNRTEFGLRYADSDEGAFVTPLTPRGDSTSIVAMSVIDATTSKAGTRNTLTVYEYEKGETRQANSSVEAEIKSSFSFLPDWASGLTVFEIVPGSDGKWIASIGQTQAVVYRAVIDADGNAVLYDQNGDPVVRSGSSDSGDGAGDGPEIEPNGDLAEMTPGQLRDLADAVLDELERRAAEPTPAP